MNTLLASLSVTNSKFILHMRLVYPYNEILPNRKAHDVYLFNECAALAHAEIDVTLLCGKGSLSFPDLLGHYGVSYSENFHLQTLPIVRKNNPLGLTWNRVFFSSCQNYLLSSRPDAVLMSVLKQGEYHLDRKISGIDYVFEIHQLAYYPTAPGKAADVERERKMLEKADWITVTTQALKEILLQPPYSLKAPIEVIPLAVHATRLPAPPNNYPLTLVYVGQLYQGQGLSSLIRALSTVDDMQLKVIGGRSEEITHFKEEARQFGVSNRVFFLGFHPPAVLPQLVKEAHGFVAPFEPIGRMPYVAHTKLLEYAAWGRPIIAPDLPVVREHLQKGAVFFEAGNADSLSHALRRFSKEHQRLQKEMNSQAICFSWSERALRYKEILTRR